MTNTGGKNSKMKKLLKNKKALSPVVAAIILIAVTVAVSIAVAAWMGSMTFTFMETEEMRVSSATIDTSPSTADTIDLIIVNTGATDVTITAATINGGDDSISLTAGAAIAYGSGTSILAGSTNTVTLTTTADLNAGSLYTIELITAAGNTYATQETA